MKFIYSPEKFDAMIKHEDVVLQKLSKIVKEYESDFAQYDCVLKVGQAWVKPHLSLSNVKRIVSYSRLPFDGKYSGLVYCDVQRNGKTVRYDNHDGEVDYYELSSSCYVSLINQFFFQLTYELFDGTNDIIEDLNDFLEVLGSKEVDFL